MAFNVPHLNADGFAQVLQPAARSQWTPAEDQLLVDGLNSYQHIVALTSKVQALKDDPRFSNGLVNRSVVALESRFQRLRQKNMLMVVPDGANLPHGIVPPPPGGGLIIVPPGFVLNPPQGPDLNVNGDEGPNENVNGAGNVGNHQLGDVNFNGDEVPNQNVNGAGNVGNHQQGANGNVNGAGNAGNQQQSVGPNGVGNAEEQFAERIANLLVPRVAAVLVPQVVEGVLAGLRGA
ncbi:hypothetical protein TSUD_260610 [Trifolium subterraneum]|nr:hypothetical protein TSUD_260610 [Trifolium subterraneum]